MMSSLDQKTERDAAFAHINDKLANGRTLSRLLLKAIQHKVGKYTYLSPKQLTSVECLQFELGHTVAPSAPRAIRVGNITGVASSKVNTQKELAEHIRQWLIDPAHFVLLQNFLAESSDNWLLRAKSQICVCGTEVYYSLLHSDRSNDTISAAIREAEDGHNFVGMVGCIPDGSPIHISVQQLSLTDLERIASSAECIFVSAYDGEGYLIWQEKPGDVQQ